MYTYISVMRVNLYYSRRETPVIEKEQYKYFFISATAALGFLCCILRDSKTHNHFLLL